VVSETADTFTVETISSEESFASLAGPWDHLVRSSAHPSPFLLHGWLSEWWGHYGHGAALSVHVAYRNGKLVAALPLVVRSRLGLRVAAFAGGRQPLMDLLLAEGEDPSVARRVGEHAVGAGQDLIEASWLTRDSSLVDALRSRLQLVWFGELPLLDTSGGWDAAYRAKTSSKQRNVHSRRRRQLAELGEVEVSLARRPDELESALEDAFRLHRLRWHGRLDQSGFVTLAGMRFNRAAIQSLAASDVARIVTLRVDGRPIAFSYYFALRGRMYLYRQAFDPAFAQFSAGLVNTLDTIDAASSEGLTLIELPITGRSHDLADRLEGLYDGVSAGATKKARVALALRLGWIHLRRRVKHSRAALRVYELRAGRKVS
jgi:CelD/BcsL family acetyltransferase involved in cellulose biosynthesis